MNKKFKDYILEVATAKEREAMKKGDPFASYYGPSRKKTEQDKKLSAMSDEDKARLEKMRKSDGRSQEEIDKEEAAIKAHIAKKSLLFPKWFTSAKTVNAIAKTDPKDKDSVIWKDGTWKDGTWEHGTWKDGTWEYGTWKDGIWERGIWEYGIWEYGIWKGGIWKGGTWKGGRIWDPKQKKYFNSNVSPKEYFK